MTDLQLCYSGAARRRYPTFQRVGTKTNHWQRRWQSARPGNDVVPSDERPLVRHSKAGEAIFTTRAWDEA
jgi:hypothetical protein